jgi:hypothetical protein
MGNERADVAADGDPPVAEIHVFKSHDANRPPPCRLDRG